MLIHRPFTLLLAFGVGFQNALTAEPQVLSIAPDSERWQMEGIARPSTFLGRESIRLDGGAALLKDFVLRDGVIDVDVATPASRGFFGIQFRLSGDDGEWVYLRQHKSTLPDAMQYTPILNTGLNWQLYSGPGFTGAVAIPQNEWFHIRLEVAGAQAKLFVKDMTKPVLVMEDLKSGVQKGQIALAVLIGETHFSNFQVRETPPIEWKRNLPDVPDGTITHWSISASLDALARDPLKPLTADEIRALKWQEVVAEPPGLVALYRYFEAPHLRVTFANDFSRRLEPQSGTKLVYAKTDINSDRDEVRKLNIGYSDEVTVFLNGQILFRGRSPQYFRDPGFLGIVDSENDAVFLPLRKGRNELVLAVGEIGGGWGFICRLEPRKS